MAAVSDISNGIANGSLSGREDYLLATVIWLCVFEKSRGERHEHSAIHAAALCKILLLRQPFDPRHAATAELIWERMCVESYIYHSAVTTLFDSRPDLIDDTLAVLEKFQRNVSVSPSAIDDQETAMSIQSSTIQSPLLGAPYHIFVALMQGIRLFRIGNTDSINNNMVAWSCYYHVSKAQSSLGPVCQHYEDPRRWIGKLYATAIRLLFLQLIPSHGVGWEIETSYLSRYTEITRTINEVRELLITTECDIEKTWGKFFLWPLAVIGALVCEKSDIILVRSWLDRVARKSANSSVLIIKEVLEKVIWQNCSDMLPASSPPFYPPGLSIMLDTNIMNNIAARLLA
ncbi:hypothetical protein BGW36DRAFT_355723 [Talaromyces proteolyticus]|uniref:Transcription factor domain-containing protein n=1 Tax=Talaromyces proteolyticus TaxID=1131652 RepID=A0AAD4KWE0_9EURO|nr:uncharacterized protein BGW36DRAFT_355723 [Talaromyces proteolyticus]KAH8701566.1 hypothetical protein BGW36DRAFT_355723 [Talaromyces proteolyticus]